MTDSIEIPVDDPLKAVWLDTSDFGNAKRVVIVAAGRLLWVDDLQMWAWYDGRRYSVERGAIEAQRVAHAVIDHIDREAIALADLLGGSEAAASKAVKAAFGDWCDLDKATKRVETLRGHSVKSGSAGMTAGMLKQARSLLTARLDEFDTDPLAYNCRNGTLRFVEDAKAPGGWRVTFREHDPADRFMQVADVDYVPDAQAPFWAERLALLTPDAEQLAALQVLYGYTLTGLTSDQAFYVHQGKGGDGKSATHLALAGLHGDYYRHAGIKTFLQGRDGGGAEHRSDLVRLRGDVRFVTSDEPKPSAVFDGEILKQITGGLVTARGANERTEITFRPKCKIFIECNKIPRSPSDDKGLRRRFKVYQWIVSLSDTPQGEMPIDRVLARLEDERSGVLNWLIKGCLDWLATRKIPQPQSMTGVLADYWADSSPLLEWMGEWCDTSDPNAKTGAKELYAHFKQWCEDGGIEHIPTSTKFGRDLRDKQFRSWKDARGVRFRMGISLRGTGMFGAGTAAPGASTGSDAMSNGAPHAAGSLPPNGPMGGNPPWPADDDGAGGNDFDIPGYDQ